MKEKEKIKSRLDSKVSDLTEVLMHSNMKEGEGRISLQLNYSVQLFKTLGPCTFLMAASCNINFALPQ